jgi:hypothetical protein
LREPFPPAAVSFLVVFRKIMRACFLGQSVCALGFGVALILIQSPPAEQPVSPSEPSAPPQDAPDRMPNRMFEALGRTVMTGDLKITHRQARAEPRQTLRLGATKKPNTRLIEGILAARPK